MTTRSRFDATLNKFKGKTPSEAYKQLCEEEEIPYQPSVSQRLPHSLPGWDQLHVLLLDDCLLGSKGAMPLLPIILVSTNLRRLSVRDCGVTDAFVLELCKILIDHPGVRSVDVRDNPLISIFCATPVLTVLRANTNITNFQLEGTHLGRNIMNIAAQLVRHNYHLVSNYYTDSFFKLKNIFGYLDADGTGWVNLPALVMSCPYPALQEQLMARIMKKQPKQRSDNTISVNAFMDLVYLNYKTEPEILAYANQEVDTRYLFMVANWKQILSGEERWNRKQNQRRRVGDEETKAPLVVLPESLHRLRVKERLLSNEEVDRLLETAIEQERLEEEEVARAKAKTAGRTHGGGRARSDNVPVTIHDDDDEAETVSSRKKRHGRGLEDIESDDNGPSSSGASSSDSIMLEEEGDGTQGGGRADLNAEERHQRVEKAVWSPSIRNVLQAARRMQLHAAAPASSGDPAPATRTRFYNDHFETSEDNSSSLDMSSILRMQAQQEENDFEKNNSDSDSDSGETVTDPEDPPHRWQLSSTLVQLIAEFFFEMLDRLPKRRQTTTPATPSAQRDRAMTRPAIPTEMFLSGVFETDFEILRPSLLAHQFKEAALPIEDTTLTLPEVVNILDEFYLHITAEKVISNDVIRTMPNPFGDPVYAEVLASYVFSQESSS